jgi:arginase
MARASEALSVALILVPYDSGRRGERLGAGPQRLLAAGLEQRIREAGHETVVHSAELPAVGWHAEIGAGFALARAVAELVGQALAERRIPLVLSGNCGPAALGVAAAVGSPAVVWFDAHGDFNTPDTTVGGFLDGMSLATITGHCWRGLAASIPGFQPIPEAAVALVGARDLDPLEAERLLGSEIRRVAARDVRTQLPPVLDQLAARGRPLYVHLDLDVLDPSEGRVNPYVAPNGLTRAEVAWAIGQIGEAARPRAASITAYSPADDSDDRVCETALGLAVALAQAAGGRNGAR